MTFLYNPKNLVPTTNKLIIDVNLHSISATKYPYPSHGDIEWSTLLKCSTKFITISTSRLLCDKKWSPTICFIAWCHAPCVYLFLVSARFPYQSNGACRSA